MVATPKNPFAFVEPGPRWWWVGGAVSKEPPGAAASALTSPPPKTVPRITQDASEHLQGLVV